MSLYDGLDIEEKEVAGQEGGPELAGWSSGFKLLQSQLQAKKASTQTKSNRRSGTTVAPVVDLRKQDDRGLYFNQKTGKVERTGSLQGDIPPFISTGPASSLLGVADEYDPLRPNDYDEFMKKRKEQKREEERQKEIEQREKRRKERHKEMGYIPQSDSDEEDDRGRKRKRDDARKSRGAAIAPPQSLLDDTSKPPPPKQEEEDIWAEVPDDLFDDGPPDKKAPPGFTFGMSGSVASKIMARMGYREGSGLGKNQQGMSMALQVEKTSKRGGKIIHERDIPKNVPMPPAAVTDSPKAESTINQTNANLLRNPSKVVLLRNMVGPGEVDAELEPETAEECGKYGKVNKCIIFEIPNQTDDEAVRIFIEFERMDAAIKAVIDLNGRYFGGKSVKASFYNLDKFRRLDLADEV